MMVVHESPNVTFDESLPKYRSSPLVDDDMIEEQVVQNHDRTQNPNCDLEEVIHRVENIREIRDHLIDQVIGELDERTLRSHAQDRRNFFAFVSTIEPKNIKEAIKDESWTMAMQEKLDQFVRNNVWDLVPCLVGHTIIGTKWVFRNKLDENSVVCRNKARLVVQVYNQQEGVDYCHTPI
ncbi:retrovirus-related pol polyprotein from transposon TNT 1-94 [Tanacetum coccineum]|uniref:Retrovirus-related pol polyprotein from transposon TNT 1-94 n=1 Tax=Tanacetum coccineum TaxID=301880 RepID=A0ABQ5GNC4_9ASTR